LNHKTFLWAFCKKKQLHGIFKNKNEKARCFVKKETIKNRFFFFEFLRIFLVG